MARHKMIADENSDKIIVENALKLYHLQFLNGLVFSVLNKNFAVILRLFIKNK